MEKNIEFLNKKCKNKKVIFYCIGNLFNELNNKFDLKKLFNIQALCDIKFKKSTQNNDFLYIPPSELKNYCFDCLIIASPNYDKIQEYLSKNNLLPKKIKIYNTEQNKTKINIKKNYKKIQKNLKLKEKIKVLFICEENEKWCYTNLYKKLKTEKKYDVLPVALFPILSKGKIIHTQNENKTFFNNLNIETIDFWDYQNNNIQDIKKLNPDIVFYQQPWYLNNINHPKNVSNYALTIMAPYGYTTLSEKEWGSSSVKEIYQSLWLFLAESPYHIKFYKKTAKMKNNLKTFGSLKLDNYKKEIKQNIWKKQENPKIIYAPHQTISNDGLRMSTFQNIYKDILNYAKNHQKYSFIYKPHPMLKNTVVEYNLMTKEEYETYENTWNNLDNSLVYDKGEYFDIFKTSDILITDCSSFLAEYFPTKNPIIFLNRKDRAPFDKFGNAIKKGFYEANNFNDVEILIENILNKKQDFLLKTRERILKKHFYIKEPAYLELINYLNKLFN